MKPQDIYAYYEQAKRRVFSILEHLEAARPLKLEKAWKQIEALSGSLAKGQRWFLMSKVFMLTPQQIAELEGLKNADSVSVLINRVSDQLRAGEIKLIEVDPEEEAAAKERLESHRKKHRERHAKKKAL